MSGNTLGNLFAVTNFGESHGPAIGCVIDGCPPGMALSEADIQPELDRRRPGTSKFVTQRQEADQVEILSGVYQGRTTGTPIALLIRNTDQRSKDYGDIAQRFRPGHADYTYWRKYGLRDPRAAPGVVVAAIPRRFPGIRIATTQGPSQMERPGGIRIGRVGGQQGPAPENVGRVGHRHRGCGAG